jgi:hypothetical protein
MENWDKPIVAVGLLSADELSRLGPSFRLAWPLEDTRCFEGLLKAIDESDRALRRSRESEPT